MRQTVIVQKVRPRAKGPQGYKEETNTSRLPWGSTTDKTTNNIDIWVAGHAFLRAIWSHKQLRETNVSA